MYLLLSKEDQSSVFVPEIHVKEEVKNIQKENISKIINNESETENQNRSERIISNIKILVSLDFNELNELKVQCGTLSGYRYFSKFNPEIMGTAFPEGEDEGFYKSLCTKAYLKLTQTNFISEPETKNLREIYSKYKEIAEYYGEFILSGGTSAEIIDGYENDMDELQTLAAEEVRRLEIEYKL